jgi:hypothetical protein
MTIQESDIIFAEPALSEDGLATSLKLGTGNGSTGKF